MEPLRPGQLKWECPMTALGFETTGDLRPTGEIVGQDRAVRAIRLGLEIPSVGYNMFVTGVSGTGRETTVKRILDSIDMETDDLRDIAFVRNMEDPRKPMALVFPAGGAERFVERLGECVHLLRSNIPAVLKSEKADHERRILQGTYQEQKKELMAGVRKEAEEKGFTIVNVPVSPTEFRPDVLPVMEGEAVTFEKLEELRDEGKLTDEDLERYERLHDELFAKLTAAYRKARDLDNEAGSRLEKLHRRLVRPTVEGILAGLGETGGEKVSAWADSILELILENLGDFAETEEGNDPFVLLAPNVILDNSERKRRPVVIEEFPDPVSLFGNIDRVVVENRPYTDHTMIRAGAIHRADGGYLIMNAMDVVRQPALWQQLIQTLRNGTSVIRSHDPLGIYPVDLHPEPISTRVKVILIGSSRLYSLLASHEPEFGLLFRIRAAFDDSMEKTEENIASFASVLAAIIESEGLPPLSAGAVAAIAEESVRVAGRKDGLSIEFNRVSDYMRQACFWAREEGAEVVGPEHVAKAVEEKVYRLDLGESYARKRILDGTLKVDTDGERVGQVNGLAVYSTVDYAFGLPARITARVTAGREGLINVEREAELSGTTHTKGMLIIAGFLRGRFASDYPLSLSASIVFEQSYGGVDGDSASSTELYALLSALADVPVRQGLAVTGSVNQHGEVQAIGGVNQKIEGFFKVCRERGLTGEQGVLIPKSNVEDLQLRDYVIEAVRNGSFSIYPVETVEQGIQLLTGLPAGSRMPDGSYGADSIYGRVDRRLRQMAETLRSFSVR